MQAIGEIVIFIAGRVNRLDLINGNGIGLFLFVTFLDKRKLVNTRFYLFIDRSLSKRYGQFTSIE